MLLEALVAPGQAASVRLVPHLPAQPEEGEPGTSLLSFEAQIALPGFTAQVADECGRRELACLMEALTRLQAGAAGPFWFAGAGHRFVLRLAGRDGKVLVMAVVGQSPFTDGLCKQEPEAVALGCDRCGPLSALSFAFLLDRQALDQPLDQAIALLAKLDAHGV